MLERLRIWILRAYFKHSPSIRSRLWTRIGDLAENDIPISTVMEFLFEGKNKGGARGFIEHQRNAMRSLSFGQAAQGWASREELMVIELTQEGRIADGLVQAARIASARADLKSTLLSSLTYPTMLAIFAGVIAAVLPPYALNLMSGIIPVEEWPKVSRNMLTFSNYIRDFGWLLIPLILLVLTFSVWLTPRWTGQIRSYCKWYPPFAIYRQLSGPEVLVAWLALMRAGVPRLKALDRLERSLSPYLASHVRIMRSRLYAGAPIETAFDTGLFTAATLEDLRAYERTGTIADKCDQIAAKDIQRTLNNLEKSSRLLSVILLVFIGGMAIWVYVGIAKVALSIQQMAF